MLRLSTNQTLHAALDKTPISIDVNYSTLQHLVPIHEKACDNPQHQPADTKPWMLKHGLENIDNEQSMAIYPGGVRRWLTHAPFVCTQTADQARVHAL